jgi:hypothetical protein
MSVTKMAMTSALALATGISAATIATGYPAQQLPTLLMLDFYIVPITGSCDEGLCKSPANDHPHEPASVNADAVAIGPTP